MNSKFLMAFTLTALVCAAFPALAIDTQDTRLMRQPAISQNHIAFIYADDLWVANRDGSDARRLTTSKGSETVPWFSPDGKWITFSGQYDGGTDVYIIPVQGGVPKRLTWHSSGDTALGFSPDGKQVLFMSGRESYTGRHAQLYMVDIEGGFPQKLKVPHTAWAGLSEDGNMIAYNPLYEAFRQWKNYRGGTYSRIWLFDRESYDVVEIPKPKGQERCNDTRPFYLGGKVYFTSDRNGEFNLFSYDPASGSVDQLTQHKDFPVLSASGGGGVVIYEQAGYLHTFNPANGQSQRLKVGIAADLVETRPRYVDGKDYAREVHLSPKGKRAVFNLRGEIVTVPAEKGSPRNLTRSTGAHDRSPAWSPDGKWIAYFSDASGEYQLMIGSQDGSSEPRAIDLEGAGFYSNAAWSPDGKHIAYMDNSLSLWIAEVASGKQTKIDSEPIYTPIVTMSYDWSPDSRWLAYTKAVEGLMQTVFIYDTTDGQSHQITDGMTEAAWPVFDASGKYLYFTASTDAGPLKDWFAMSNNDMSFSSSVYMAVLDDKTPSPLLPESDEAEVAAEKPEPKEEKAEKKKGKKDKKDDKAKKEENKDSGPKTKIVFEGLNQRILNLPLPAGTYQLAAGGEGELFMLASEGGNGFAAFGGPGTLKKFSLKSKKAEDIAQNVFAFVISHDKSKLLYASGPNYFLVGTGGPAKPGKGRLSLDSIKLNIEPRAEWPNIYNEAWRLNRDYFYATNFHGVDWDAERAKYEPFLAHATNRRDVNRIIQWLSSELAVGHHRGGGGDTLTEAGSVRAGLLGCDFEVADGRYRFKQIFDGENWNPNLRAPLTEPGVNAKVGEYLLAVNGVELKAPANVFSLFENTVNQVTEIRIGPNADGSDARDVLVKPIANDRGLRNRAWVEGNRRKVEEATGGRIAYVYVPNTTTAGHTYFKRYFYPQSHKDGIIVDERHNGGGQIADYYIDMLRRPHIAMWAMRYGEDLTSPRGTIDGPKVMLIDETAGSGGDLLPFMWRKFDMGPMIGRRTWGGLVGILGFPNLMDGGSITAPNVAIFTEDGWVVENAGVPPDIEVEQTPKDMIAGRDPQLEKAIEVVMDMLEKNPPVERKRPKSFPARNQ